MHASRENYDKLGKSKCFEILAASRHKKGISKRNETVRIFHLLSSASLFCKSCCCYEFVPDSSCKVTQGLLMLLCNSPNESWRWEWPRQGVKCKVRITSRLQGLGGAWVQQRKEGAKSSSSRYTELALNFNRVWFYHIQQALVDKAHRQYQSSNIWTLSSDSTTLPWVIAHRRLYTHPRRVVAAVSPGKARGWCESQRGSPGPDKFQYHNIK